MKTSRSTLIGTAIAFALYQQSAMAQAPTAAPTSDSEELDEVIVTGIRASLEQSLDVKRNADARLEVVTAEDIGKLPAHNVADALRGLPGVNISSSSADEGGFDESDRVSLRGTSPSLTQTLINGHSVGSADWFVLSQGNNVGRSVSCPRSSSTRWRSTSPPTRGCRKAAPPAPSTSSRESRSSSTNR
jgi:iron complex outermembrane receptor protein